MATKVTRIGRAEIENYKNRLARMRDQAKGVTSKANRAVETVVRSAVVGGTSFAMGAARGRFGKVEVLGAPVELGIGVAAHLAGGLGLAGKMSPHLHAIGDAGVAVFAFDLGQSVSKDWGKDPSAQPPAVKGDDDRKALGERRLTRNDLADLTAKPETVNS